MLCYPAQAVHVAQIERSLAESSIDAVVIDAGQERVAEELLSADIYCGHAKVPVDWDAVVARGRLRWIQSSAAGMDHCLTPAVVDSKIAVTSASGLLADQVAEQTLALLLGCLRSLPTFFAAQRAREFVRRPTRDLHGCRVGIVGLGGNGRRLVEVLRPFRPSIVATDWFPTQPPAGVDSVHAPEELDSLLPEIDVLLLTPPLTDATRGLINARRISLLPQGATLINVARGPIVVEDALVDALRSGHLAGAGVDVTEVEPLPAESRLWDAPNCLITPHVGGQAAWRLDRMTDFFCDNLSRFFANRPMRNRVEKSLGFPTPGNAAWAIDAL
ncbi:MAG: D-2-hydroxyacid dehydrogenase [Planctomycetota bacterium]